MAIRLIKYYRNRKYYDTKYGGHVNLNEITKMTRNKEEVIIVDHRTKKDITASVFMQIIFDLEKQADLHAPLSTFVEIIRGNIPLSEYLSKLMKKEIK
jgi:polyhydroxyalkanoate synthesis repressor PhaR